MSIKNSLFSLILSFVGFAALTVAHAEPAGAPGIPHRWAPAAKQAIGTAYESSGAASPVWFTLAEGILTEVFYPSVDQAQVGDLQFIVTDGEHYFSEQKADTISKVSYSDEGMSVHVSGEDKSGRYAFTQDYVTDPAAPVVRIRTTIRWMQPHLRLFVLFKPAINNTGSQNLASASSDGLFATKVTGRSESLNAPHTHTDGPVHAALVASSPWSSTSVGYVGFSDGWQDLHSNFRITQNWHEAGPGNIALTGELPVGPGSDFTYELALGFGTSRSEALTYAKTSLQVPFSELKNDYESGWHGYLKELESSPLVRDKRFFSESTFARRSAQLIKMHEDKRHRGAIIASLSKPAVPDSEHAMDGTGGYHLVWPRDLYHAATGLLAAGDSKTAIDVLHFLVQNQKPEGSWSQNFWVDGTPYWQGLQMDEVSFPILLAAKLQERGAYHLDHYDLDMVRKAASFLISHGPVTQQDRWEEIGGYVPSTLAAEISALRVASLLTGDPSLANVANQWQSLIERWTLVPDGPLGRNYYLRVSPNGTPENPEPIDIANGGGRAFAWDILDGGFLDLVRLGIRTPHDPRILTTLKLYETPGMGIAEPDPRTAEALIYRRYNRDGYGPNGKGGLWPLLAGERGHYSVAAGNLDNARSQLFIMEKSALSTGLLPEQTITPPAASGRQSENGAEVGRGVACPLVWAHAEDILLHRSIEEGTVFDAPRASP